MKRLFLHWRANNCESKLPLDLTLGGRPVLHICYIFAADRTVSTSYPGLLAPRLADNGVFWIGRLVPYLSISSPGVFSFYIIIYIIFVPVKCELSESWERKTTLCELRNLMSNDSSRLSITQQLFKTRGGLQAAMLLCFFFFRIYVVTLEQQEK